MTAIDPTIRAELDALEAALNGAPGADPQLVALVEDVRATAVPMPPALKASLADRVAAGFPREGARAGGQDPAPRRLRFFGIPALPALGALATALVALVVAGTALRGADTGTRGDDGATSALSVPPSTAQTEQEAAAPKDATTSGGAGATAGAPEAAVTPSTGVVTATPAPGPSPQSDDTRGFARKVERAVQLGLRVGRDDLEETADGVVRVTQALGGYVSVSTVSARDGGGTADFTLRIPSARLDRAIAQLSRLGHVSRLDQSAQDITGSFVSVADQLRDVRAERRALLRALAKATTQGQIASLRARLRANRSEIAQLKGRMAALRRRANLATVDVSIVARGKATVAPKHDDGWSPGDAARDALRVLEVLAGVLLVSLAVIVPLGLLAAALALAARALRRRSREHALDAG